MRILIIAFMLAFSASGVITQESKTIRIASKNFNENYLLAEITSQLLEIEGYKVDRKFGLGGTLVCYEALADSRGISTVSDLAKEKNLRMSFDLEFLNREDGWPGLAATYGMKNNPGGIDHGLAYQAIDGGNIDITDAYSTDGDLERYELTVLEDDKGYFPQYFAVPLLRQDVPIEVVKIISRLQGRIDDDHMRELNSRIVIDGYTFAQVASGFLASEDLGQFQIDENLLWKNLGRNTLVHLKLTVIALFLGCLFGLRFQSLCSETPALPEALFMLRVFCRRSPPSHCWH